MIKLKELLLELSGVAHSKKSLEWVSMDFIPMTPKVIKQIRPKCVERSFKLLSHTHFIL